MPFSLSEPNFNISMLLQFLWFMHCSCKAISYTVDKKLYQLLRYRLVTSVRLLTDKLEQGAVEKLSLR
jgi:hypothetical protein